MKRDDVLTYWGNHDNAYEPQIPIWIILTNGVRLGSLFNPSLRTVTIGATMFPERDLRKMLKLMFNQELRAITGIRQGG
jgi:hypothetical protein